MRCVTSHSVTSTRHASPLFACNACTLGVGPTTLSLFSLTVNHRSHSVYKHSHSIFISYIHININTCYNNYIYNFQLTLTYSSLSLVAAHQHCYNWWSLTGKQHRQHWTQKFTLQHIHRHSSNITILHQH